VRIAEQMTLRGHRFRIAHAEKQFLDLAKGQASGSVEMIVDRGGEDDIAACQDIRRHGHNCRLGLYSPSAGLDRYTRAAMIDSVNACFERKGEG